MSPPHLPSTFDIYRLTFNIKRASAGSKKPSSLSSALSSYTSHSEYLPVHKWNRAPHLYAAVGAAEVARGAHTPTFHVSRAAVPASDPPPPLCAVLECAAANLMFNTVQVGIVPLMALAPKHSSPNTAIAVLGSE